MWTFLIVCVPYNSDQINELKIMEERENEGESYQPYVIKGSTTQVWTKDLGLEKKVWLEDNSIFLLPKIVKWSLSKIGHRIDYSLFGYGLVIPNR